MDLNSFRTLSPHHRALVAVAVLLDGREAGIYLENDRDAGDELVRAAADLGALSPEIRMPVAGTLLRQALKELG